MLTFDYDSREPVKGILFRIVSVVASVTPRNILIKQQKGLVKIINPKVRPSKEPLETS
jgi:hypothetical protein